MAYNYTTPNIYQPYMPNYYSQPQFAQQQQVQPQVQQQNVGTGFVRVQSENDARMYPVSPGTSVIFINENEPYCYTKTVDVSQLDRPKFEKYRLVKEETPTQQPVSESYASKSDVEFLRKEIEEIKRSVAQKERPVDASSLA